MSDATWLLCYCIAILAASMGGGYVPFVGKITHGRLQMYLSLSAGIMLGAAFFHVMPDAMENAKASFGWWMALGVVGLFCIERFIAPHSHEVTGNGHDHHAHHHDHPEVKAREHAREMGAACSHAHYPVEEGDHRAAAPVVAGWAAVFGLTIHTFMNGVGLAGEVASDRSKAIALFPGLAIFLAIVLHKPADALAISTVLTRKGVARAKLTLVQLGFGLMVPIGVIAFQMSSGMIAESMRQQLIGAALAFSAGTFLFIALSDLLPEVQFHRHDRFRLFAILVSGVAFMGFIGFLEDMGGAHGDKEKPAAVQPAAAPK
jgi:zinc and cadmium transporter